jgi:hypothetical protein
MKSLIWLNFILCMWLIVAPFALHYENTTVVTWNNVIIGIVVAILAIYRALEKSDLEAVAEHHSAH